MKYILLIFIMGFLLCSCLPSSIMREECEITVRPVENIKQNEK